LGLGKSDKLTVAHTAGEIVEDLHQLLQAAHVPQPYVMVGHSIGGIYVRKYASIYPAEVVGLVLVDSAHEEQFSPCHRFRPNGPSEFTTDFQPTNSERRDSYRRTSVWHGISMGH
jgi:pimeloyl-ACP methyl ester carboxylesterase